MPEIAGHLERFAAPGPNGLVFIGPKGGRLRRSNFRKFWHRAREAVGMPELHFHDLRHTGNTMAAAEGASLRELMERMGHSSPRVAHFHAYHVGRRASVSVDGTVLAGSLEPRALPFVREWAGLHRQEILANWDRARKSEPLLDIPPLP